MGEIKALLLADIHFVKAANHICSIKERKCDKGLLFASKAIKEGKKQNADVLILLGDLIDNAAAKGAWTDINALRDEALGADLPVIVAPGNHDGDGGKVLEAFNDYQGVHNIKGYQFINFADKYDKFDNCTRSSSKMKAFFAKADKSGTIITLQHNPIFPKIYTKYPYNITNAKEVMACYSANSVALSISGHYHRGIQMSKAEGVNYLTCKALCEEPHVYTMLTLKGRSLAVEEFYLEL